MQSIVISLFALDFDNISSCSISGSENILLREYPVSRIFGTGTLPISIVAFLTVGNERSTSQKQIQTKHTSDRSTPHNTDNRRAGKQRNNLSISRQLRRTHRHCECRCATCSDS